MPRLLLRTLITKIKWKPSPLSLFVYNFKKMKNLPPSGEEKHQQSVYDLFFVSSCTVTKICVLLCQRRSINCRDGQCCFFITKRASRCTQFWYKKVSSPKTSLFQHSFIVLITCLATKKTVILMKKTVFSVEKMFYRNLKGRQVGG